MKQYKELVQKVKEEGSSSKDRTGTGTRKIFGHMMKFDCSSSLPLVTLKYTHYPAIIHELLWFISGNTNIKYLKENNVNIWDEWADPFGNIGPIYGGQWRAAGAEVRDSIRGWSKSGGVDQLGNAIDLIKNKPESRRIIVDCWDPLSLPDEEYSPRENVGLGMMALAPCHMMFHFQVNNNVLNLVMYQRSVDSFLGLPFNIASYAILLNLVAMVTNTTPGVFTWMGGDIHIYNNHMLQVDEMLGREPLTPPKLVLNRKTNIESFDYDDIKIIEYNYHPSIKAPISV